MFCLTAPDDAPMRLKSRTHSWVLFVEVEWDDSAASFVAGVEPPSDAKALLTEAVLVVDADEEWLCALWEWSDHEKRCAWWSLVCVLPVPPVFGGLDGVVGP